MVRAIYSPKAIHLLPVEPGEILGRLKILEKTLLSWSLVRLCEETLEAVM